MRERESAKEWRRGRERERETQDPKQAPGSELLAQSPTWDWGLTNQEIVT